MNLVDRTLRMAWHLVLLLLVLAVLLPIAGRFVREAVAVVVNVLAQALGPLMGSGLVGALLLIFLIGLGVRLARSARDPASARRSQADRVRLRRTVRRRADDVPPFGAARQVPPDEDPTLPFGDA